MHGRARGKTIALFPWLDLRTEVRIGEVRFLPFTAGVPSRELRPIRRALEALLSAYKEIDATPVSSVTAAVPTSRAPGDYLLLGDRQLTQTAALLLCLSALARNDYCPRAAYANSVPFRPVFHTYLGQPERIALSARRRLGGWTDAGYRPSEVSLARPLECVHVTQPPEVDRCLANALGEAWKAGSAAVRGLIPALSFLALANTDSDVVLEETELILIATAFEQLLGSQGARAISDRAACLLRPYGCARTRGALTARPGIQSGLRRDKRHSWRYDKKLAATQKAWYVHQMWVQELHDRRSDLIHGLPPGTRTWGWSDSEHLAMAAFVFPLLVKLLLAKEGRYSLSEEDQCRCHGVDRILVQPDWARAASKTGVPCVWEKALADVREQRALEEAFAAAKRRRRSNAD